MKALKLARAALTTSADDASAWALLALILTARREKQLAHSVLDAGLAATHASEHYLLLRIRAKLYTTQGIETFNVSVTLCDGEVHWRLAVAYNRAALLARKKFCHQ